MEIIPGDNLNSLSHTEKILLFTNVGIKNDDKIMILAADEDKKTFVLLLNPKFPKDQIDFLLR